MHNEDRYYAQIGALIKKRREALTLTQADVATSAGLSRTSLTNIESGRQRLMVDQLQKICTSLDMPITTLLNKVELDSKAVAPAVVETPPVVEEFLRSVGLSRAG